MDETRLDPQTPAHIFAYRAFRSVFVGSPASSPVRPVCDENNISNTSPKKPSRFTTSPVHAKRSIDNQTVLTPKRQKTVPVSPSKSILRNKNTPRRQGLRDATVTFKSVSASSSPQSKAKPATKPGQLTKLAFDSVPSFEVGNHHVEKRHEAVIMNVDLQAYKQQTEKEMRRLMKYATKWKDEAKKRETETQRLQKQIVDLQQSNDDLQRRLAEIEHGNQQQRHQFTQRRRQSTSPEVLKAKSQTTRTSDIQREVVDSRPDQLSGRRSTSKDPRTNETGHVSMSNRTMPTRTRAQQDRDPSLSPSAPVPYTQVVNDAIPSATLATATNIRPMLGYIKHSALNHGGQPGIPILPQEKLSRKSVLSLPDSTESSPKMQSLPTRSIKAGIADKKAAIRARLAAKNAARKTADSPVMQNKSQDSSKTEEESQFDWADV